MKKAAFLFSLCGIEKRRLCGTLMFWKELVLSFFDDMLVLRSRTIRSHILHEVGYRISAGLECRG